MDSIAAMARPIGGISTLPCVAESPDNLGRQRSSDSTRRLRVFWSGSRPLARTFALARHTF